MTSTTNDIVKKWYVVRAVSGKEKKVKEAREVIDQHVARGLERVVTHFEEQPTKAKKAK